MDQKKIDALKNLARHPKPEMSNPVLVKIDEEGNIVKIK